MDFEVGDEVLVVGDKTKDGQQNIKQYIGNKYIINYIGESNFTDCKYYLKVTENSTLGFRKSELQYPDVEISNKTANVLDEEEISKMVVEELICATEKHGKMNSAHEGYAVIFEELDELWDEIKIRDKSKQRMREEAIQVAAMAMKFIRDIT